MALCTSRAVGVYVASEAHSCAYGRLYNFDATKRPIIYFTGGPGDDRDFLTATASGSQLTPQLVENGIPFISAAFGGANLWGNDTAQTRIGQAWTQVKSQLGTKTDKFIGIGVSKGMTALLNYARNNPGNVAALLGIVPAVDVSDIHDNNRGGNAANIDTAYAADWAGAKAAHDPALNTVTHLSQAIPMKLLYGTADTVVLPATVTSFASAVGATAVSMGATDHTTTAPAVDSYADVLRFIAPYL